MYDGAAATDKPVKDENGKQVFFGDVQDTVGTTALVGHADGRQSNRISFQYDALGHLVRTNDPFDSTAGLQGTTWVFNYDQGGNILSKVAYPFTEGEVGAAIHTDTYTYGNANWKDQLTAYNDVPITYDAIGNPLSDGIWTYIWQHGRQLAQTSKDGETVSFVYNEDGLRVQKTATSTGTTKYILHGKSIVHLTNGNDELHFFYDAQGRVAVVEFNGTPYRYVHNLQGDIVALVDGNGEKVVEYWYDAWGKPTVKVGSMSSTLGTVQPFRYRGYVWDEETGLYYLRSRYYRPEWGRFISPDVRFSDNLYCYCLCDPISEADDEGFESTYVNTDIYLVDGLGRNIYFIAEGTRVEIIDQGVESLTVHGSIYSFESESWIYLDYYMDRSEVSNDIRYILFGTRTSFREYDHAQRFFDIVLMIRDIRESEGFNILEIDNTSHDAFIKTATLSFQCIYPENELKHDGDPGPKTAEKVIEYITRLIPPYNGALPSIPFGLFPKSKKTKERKI